MTTRGSLGVCSYVRRRVQTVGLLARISVAASILIPAVLAGSAEQQVSAPQSQSRPEGRACIAQGESSQRGESIYYIKCNFCHAEIAKWAPSLKNLYKRPKLVFGKPVNDETVADQIRNGSRGMPSFKHTLSDSDIADLVNYLREGKCCPDMENPPLNPKYRYR